MFLFQRFSQCSSAHLHVLLSFCWWKREEEEEEEEEVCNQEFFVCGYVCSNSIGIDFEAVSLLLP